MEISTTNAAFAALEKCPRRPLKRPIKALSWELAGHAKAYLEADQYAQGYEFLYALLSAGHSISVPAKTYVGYLAPPVQLALASSLVVYPRITTKTRSAVDIKGSNAALRYLRCVYDTLDYPAFQVIRQAFSFPEERVRRRPLKSGAGSPLLGAISDVEQLHGRAATEESLWHAAEDFWHVVGWAFNCSVAHKKRWARWKLWLDAMLSFLEADWEASMKRVKLDDVDREITLQQTLIWRYVSSLDPTNRTTRRRINRAILAVADTQSLSMFHEVWQHEAAELKPRDETRKPVGHVDFETGQLGDYASDDEDAVMEDAPEENESLGLQNGSPVPVDAVEGLGGSDAIQLRQRLISLIAHVAEALPADFCNPEAFFDTLSEEFRTLPIQTFRILLSTFRLPLEFQVTLYANCLLPMISGQKMRRFTNLPVQSELEDDILNLKGSTQSFSMSAKVSLIIEQICVVMMENKLLEPTDRLRQAVEHGISTRESVYGTGKSKKGNAYEEEQGELIMQAASRRLLDLLEILEMSAGKEPAPRKVNNGLVNASFTSSLSSPPGSDLEEEE